MHHPFFSKKSTDNYPMIAELIDYFLTYKVDLVFAGHEHMQIHCSLKYNTAKEFFNYTAQYDSRQN